VGYAFVFTTWLLALTVALAGPEKDAGNCEAIAYADRNQFDYGPLRIAAVRGFARDSQGIAIPQVCLGVFTESDHRLVASGQTDQDGHFELKRVAKGDYRLVAQYDSFAPANAKLRVGGLWTGKALEVQMRPAGLDSGSSIRVK
jgi:hypothetical protein